ncbi:alpha/beta fold hydrolase [Haloarchaeobius amylolyticus]|uniref:alpha/beta fold hydrolase n=1 Tax=Haloarchaeobius amylolyticus TaxID=1198296 RepID=UPI00226EFF48|nr:alpha/beta hydrolase [Haloarchaeobius amylolyticus]
MNNSIDSLNEDIGFVLVHGAGFDVWIWENVAPLIEAPTLSASFPARKADQSARDSLRLVGYTGAILEQVDEWDVRRVVLVGHSVGGTVCVELADCLSERVVGLVGVCAGIPAPGQSFLSSFPLHQRIVQKFILRFSGTRPPESVIRLSLCAELSDTQTDYIVSEFIPESRHLFTDAVKGEIPEIPTRYIRTRSDKSISANQQDKIVDAMGADDVVTLDTGHLPMLSSPAELASALTDFADQIR